ncbi:proton-coupled amino acid transporter-like protein CG1139 [Euwallacea fornicatus]|uniref:proton-coupled amino acid transporter-like protein CG1139 n=1 Tax=Euwallacea fornicatus TaxID=995702 RepID=UPI00338F8331
MEVAERPKDPGLATSLNDFNSTWTLIKEQDYHFTAASGREEIKPDYNPYEHRQVEHPNGYLSAFLHIAKISLGTGILAIPRAFKSAGLVVGFIGTILVGLLCTHAIHILVKASQKVCRKTRTPSLGFADTAEGVFKLGPNALRRHSRFAKIFVEASLFSVHFLACSVYLVFISISLTELFSTHFPIVNTWDIYIFKLIILAPLLICGQVRELKHLVPFSFIANMMLLVTFATTGYYLFSEIDKVDIRERNMVTTFSGIPSFLSTVLFSMEGIGTIMPVENSMVTPSFIGCFGVLNSAMTVIITLYTAIGFFGYYKFGEKTEATITASLPRNQIVAEVAQGAIAIAVFFSFMLVFYVPVDIVWSYIKHRISKSRWNISQIILRCTMILTITGIAIAGGQNLGQLIDLVGAIFLSTLGLFVPAFLDLIVDWDEGWGAYNWRLFKDLVVMAFAIFGLVSGVFCAIQGFIG